MVQGLVQSRLECCNAVLARLPDSELAKLRTVKKIAAKMILGKNKTDSETECRKQLHWLPIKA